MAFAWKECGINFLNEDTGV